MPRAQDCVWITTLQRQGHDRQAIFGAVSDLTVRYSPAELQRWISGYDIVAVQEADPAFCEALGSLSHPMVRGENDLDGRGIEVESCSALILQNAKLLRQEQAVLSFRPMGRGVTVSREHFVALVERPDSEQLVVCSVHLHVPDMIRKSGLQYVDYLYPLRAALEAVAGQQGSTLQMPCLLLGDFNMDPAVFQQISIEDTFWKQCFG